MFVTGETCFSRQRSEGAEAARRSILDQEDDFTCCHIRVLQYFCDHVHFLLWNKGGEGCRSFFSNLLRLRGAHWDCGFGGGERIVKKYASVVLPDDEGKMKNRSYFASGWVCSCHAGDGGGTGEISGHPSPRSV